MMHLMQTLNGRVLMQLAKFFSLLWIIHALFSLPSLHFREEILTNYYTSSCLRMDVFMIFVFIHTFKNYRSFAFSLVKWKNIHEYQKKSMSWLTVLQRMRDWPWAYDGMIQCGVQKLGINGPRQLPYDTQWV